MAVSITFRFIIGCFASRLSLYDLPVAGEPACCWHSGGSSRTQPSTQPPCFGALWPQPLPTSGPLCDHIRVPELGRVLGKRSQKREMVRSFVLVNSSIRGKIGKIAEDCIKFPQKSYCYTWFTLVGPLAVLLYCVGFAAAQQLLPQRLARVGPLYTPIGVGATDFVARSHFVDILSAARRVPLTQRICPLWVRRGELSGRMFDALLP